MERERNHLARHGHEAAEAIVLGAMLEVPALLWQLDELFRAVDFVSVGSNDLMQFIMASDRANTRLAGRFDPLAPAFLRVLRTIAGKAAEAGKPLALCGEIAGRPLDAIVLAAIGYRSLSMASSAVADPVKAADPRGLIDAEAARRARGTRLIDAARFRIRDAGGDGSVPAHRRAQTHGGPPRSDGSRAAPPG